jgi:hypothetical protein
MNANTATIISAIASLIYAVVATISLWLLSRQIRDARRFGAAPALYALLKEMDDQMAAVRKLGDRSIDDPEVREGISNCLDFFERIEHMRSAGVIPANVLRRGFGYALETHLADPRFAEVIRQDRRQYQEVLTLAKLIGRR